MPERSLAVYVRGTKKITNIVRMEVSDRHGKEK